MEDHGAQKSWDTVGSFTPRARLWEGRSRFTLESMPSAENDAASVGRTVDNVPPRPSGMVVRHDLHAALCDALEPDSSIVDVQGMGGTGKTWLALDVANTVQGTHLFANVIWTTARDAPLTFDAWLRRIARALSRADLATLSPEHLEPAVAGLLGDRAVLLVVDNFESIAAIEQDKILGLAR